MPVVADIPVKDAVLSALEKAGHPLSPKEMADYGEAKYNSIKTTVIRMEKDGELERVRTGVYKLPHRHTDTPDTTPAKEKPAPAETGAPALPPEMRYVALVGVKADAGNGEVPFEVKVERQVAYDTRQLRSAGVDPNRAVLIPVTGDSMEPTLSAGDALLVERHAGEPLRDGTIYVLRRDIYGVIVKRLYWTDDKIVELRSDNPDGPTLTMRPENQDEWEVIGRVVRVEKAL